MAVTVRGRANSVPSFFVFSRNNFRAYFIANGPVSSAGSVNRSGWIPGVDFLLPMEHFMKGTKATKDKPILLLLVSKSHYEFLPLPGKLERCYCPPHLIALTNCNPLQVHGRTLQEVSEECV
jgi:hypothetical protein